MQAVNVRRMAHLRKLLKYLRPYTKECVLGPLFKLIEATLELLVPLVMAAIIDRGIGTGNKTFIVQRAGLLGLLGVLGLCCALVAQYFAAKASVGAVARMRSALFSHIQRLSYGTLDRVSTPTLVTRMTSDLDQVRSGLNLVLRLLLRSPFVVFGAMIMAFTLDVKAALVFVVVIPLLAVAVFGIMLPCIPLYKKVQTRLDRVLEHTRENLTGVRVIRAFRKEESEIRAFDADNEALTGAQNFVGRIGALLDPLTYVLINGALLVLLWTGAIRVETGVLSQGVVVALYNYMSQILVELIKLANLIITVTKSIACGNRVQAILDLPATDPAPAQEKQALSAVPGAPRVAFDHVTLRYHEGSAPALDDITLSVGAGETLGIIGGTSAGKTSLVNLIPHFYEATSGRVLIDGTDVRDIPTDALRARIGVVPQQAVLFHGTVRDNLQWGDMTASDEVLWQALEAAQARAVVEDKPGGLDFMIEQGGRNLSGGQRQRLTIARALVRRPDILLLDDSAAALDQATEAALRHALRHLPNDPTILVISQRIASVRGADRIAVLEDGRLVGLGTHDELLADCPVYAEIAHAQLPKEVQTHG